MSQGGKTVAIVVAAGSGRRTGGALPKQYRKIGGRAVLAHAVDALMHPRIDEIRVVIGPVRSRFTPKRWATGPCPPPSPAAPNGGNRC
jgi:2-C-methyl-D-erythritol 4-phosphate cytidylyltransferase/2-C-methyl-D-erythritol 2,4-cyclodiphosphate synthase